MRLSSHLFRQVFFSGRQSYCFMHKASFIIDKASIKPKKSTDVASVHKDASSDMMDNAFAGGRLQLCFSSFPALKQFKCPFRGFVHHVRSQTLQELDLQHWDTGREVSGVNVALDSLPRLEILRLNLHVKAKVVTSPISLVTACICWLINAFGS